MKRIAIAVLVVTPIWAQTTTAGSPSGGPTLSLGPAVGFSAVSITAAMPGAAATVAGAPYSAQTMTQTVQVLADGNRIEQTASGTVARDKQGRVRREEALPALGPNGEAAPRIVFIEDPVAGVHWNLSPEAKVAVKMPFAGASGHPAQIATVTRSAGLSAGAPPPPLPPPPPLGPNQTFFVSSPPPNIQFAARGKFEPDSDVSKTDLGTQMFDGVAAQGTRVTRTLPAGSVGNEQPLVVTTETWYSPELKVLVMTKTSDPRMGETTYKLTGIQRGDPPASLFEVPSDYTVKDHPENMFFAPPAQKAH